MHPRMPLAFLTARAHCWLINNLSSTRTPKSLSTELLSSRSAPSLYWCMRLFLPRCRTLHLPFLNFIRFLSAQLSSVSRCRWMAAQPCDVSTTPLSFVLSANLLRVHCNSSSRSLMKTLNKTGPSTDPCVPGFEGFRDSWVCSTEAGLGTVDYISGISRDLLNQVLKTKFSGLFIYSQVFRKNWSFSLRKADRMWKFALVIFSMHFFFFKPNPVKSTLMQLLWERVVNSYFLYLLLTI